MRTYGRSSYGVTVPMPSDAAGEPLKLGSLQVLQRVDGIYILCDWDKPFGDETVFVTTRGLNRCVSVMRQWHRWKKWQGPLRRGETRKQAIRILP